MNLLEISAWPWLDRLSRREGRLVTLAEVPSSEWDAVARHGLDIVYLMGVWKRSPIGRAIARTHPGLLEDYTRALPGWTAADVVGSPYSIQAYEPDERMGGWRGLDSARRALQSRGIRLLLDLVPNHTAFDHAWVQAHPERYVLGTADDDRADPAHFRRVDTAVGSVLVACARDPFFPPWTDVAQLNYCNPETREAMRAELRTIAAHCDGVRCDMAMLLLNDVFERTWRGVLRGTWPRQPEEFWPAATAMLPDFTFLAEVYWSLEGTLLNQGFDFAYDKRLLDCLHGPAPGPCVRALLAGDIPPGRQLARFLENHDEPRSKAALGARLPAAAVLASTVPGLHFFFDGQFDGRRVRTPVQLGRWADEEPDAAVREMYDRVLRFGRSEVAQKGEWQLLASSSAGDDSFSALVGCRWRRNGTLALAVANPAGTPAQAYFTLSADLPEGDTFDFIDRLSGAAYRRTRADLARIGLFVRLEAGQAHLFDVLTV